MSIPIQNGKDLPLGANPGTLPNMAGTILDWFQKMTFTVVQKSTQNFDLVEEGTQVEFEGVWQPFTEEQLQIKPEGQRSWSWFMVHAAISLPLKTDDVIEYQGQNYRVMALLNYSSYGYYEYHIILDYNGSGP